MNSPAKETSASEGALSQTDVRAILVVLMCVMFLAALESTIIAPALPSIGRELGDVENMPWIVTSYLIVTTALTPLYGKLGDIRGRRVVLIFATVSFLIGSLACALANSMLMLILARCLQGVGGGGIFAMVQTIIGDIVPLKDRARFQVYTSSVWLAANVAGPLLGGILTEFMHWSMIFWLNLPLGIPALIIIWPKLRRLPRNERPRSLDIPGVLLIIVATVLTMLALSWGGVRYPWTSVQIFSLAAGAVAVWIMLAARLATAPEPIIAVRILQNRAVLFAVLTSFFGMAAYVGLTVWLPVWLQTVSGLGVAAAGLASMPLLVFTTIGSQLGARAMRAGGNYHLLSLAGLLVAGAGTIALAPFAAGMHLMLLAVLLTIVAVGMGAVWPLLTVTLQYTVRPHDLGTTMALNVFMRSLGSAAGVAVMGAIVIGIAGPEAIEKQGASAAPTAALATGFAWAYVVSGLLFLVAAVTLWLLGARPIPGYDAPEKQR